jgi:glutathione peroxidase
MAAHGFSFTSIDGKPMNLSDFAGNAVLVVNTASACGMTPQYRELEALWRKYKARGLVVLGVPSNDFGAQEPGTENEIKTFCSRNYDVTFPMTSKNKVSGGAAHPFYKWVVEEAGEAAAPRWNFHKYLLGRDGALVGSYGSKIKPDAPEIVRDIENELGHQA